MYKEDFINMLNSGKVVGYQDEREVEVAKKLIEERKEADIMYLWLDGVNKMNGAEYDEWSELVKNSEKIYVFVTNMTGAVEDLDLISISLSTIAESRTFVPMIALMVDYETKD